MRTISGKFFTVKVKVDRDQEEGLVKSVKEDYAVLAVNFTDCEAKTTKEVGEADTVRGSFEILAEAVAPYKEIFVFDDGETWYKVKIAEITLDDYGKEKKTSLFYLLNATSFEQARKNIVEALGGTMSDYTIAAIIEQKVLEVLE